VRTEGKDPQRDAVYDWEGEFRDWNRKTLSLSDVRAFVRTACAYYGVKPPSVHHHTGRAYAFTQGRKLSFPDWCMNPAVALHEAAHYIADQLFGNELQDHGETWLGIYLWLLEKAAVAPRKALTASMRLYKLKAKRMPPERARLASGKEPFLPAAVAEALRFPAHLYGPTPETER
jgi:hypothetical protein